MQVFWGMYACQHRYPQLTVVKALRLYIGIRARHIASSQRGIFKPVFSDVLQAGAFILDSEGIVNPVLLLVVRTIIILSDFHPYLITSVMLGLI